jgi:DnaJ-class molecular chaperone
LQSAATPEQIKEAYRKLVKKFHPDARASQMTDIHEPNADKFRNVTEAYQVLSLRESRVNYDITRKKNPDAYKPMSAKEEELVNRRDTRDKKGLTPKDKPLRGSYAEERLQQLKKEREKYNVNHLGYYQGGLPK